MKRILEKVQGPFGMRTMIAERKAITLYTSTGNPNEEYVRRYGHELHTLFLFDEAGNLESFSSYKGEDY